jgi:hypothetical protein
MDAKHWDEQDLHWDVKLAERLPYWMASKDG